MNYKNARIEDLVEHFKNVSRQAVDKASKYYLGKGDLEVFDKIEQARAKIKAEKLDLRRGEIKMKLENSATFKSCAIGGDITFSPAYQIWNAMMQRCREGSARALTAHTYSDCTVSDNFKVFEYFNSWCHKQAGFQEKDEKGRVYHLDKDLLVRGNRVYSEDTCVFVPSKVNQFIKLKAINTDYPVGVSFKEDNNRFIAQSNDIDGNRVYLGSFETIQAASLEYKKFKESMAKLLAINFKDTIDPRAFSALMNFEVNFDN